jgi:TonB family protein
MRVVGCSIAIASFFLFADWASAFELADEEWKSRCPRIVTREDLNARGIDFRPINPPQVRYPRAKAEAEQDGFARVLARVDTEGRVVDIQLVTATDPAFADSALSGVKLWRYAPTVIEGKPTCVEANVDVTFTSHY